MALPFERPRFRRHTGSGGGSGGAGEAPDADRVGGEAPPREAKKR
jgi:hypothetical protein